MDPGIDEKYFKPRASGWIALDCVIEILFKVEH